MKGIAIPIALLTALPLFPGSMSSMSTEPGYFDSSACPAPRIADADGTIEVFANGEWFSETEGELFVDGVKVSDISPDKVSKIVLSGAANGDLKWNSAAMVRPAFDDDKWTLDITLPYEAFGGAPKAGDKWKMMIIRNSGSREFQACGWPIPAHRDFSSAATLVFK